MYRLTLTGNTFIKMLKLKKYNRTKIAVKQLYKETVANICGNVEKRFQGIIDRPIFANIESIFGYIVNAH